MKRRVLGSAVLAAALILTAQPAAQAAPPARFTLANFSVQVDPGDSEAPGCNRGQAGDCGYLITTSVFRGLDQFPRPSETLYNAGNLTGSIEVTRTYGCRDATGKRLHRLDRKVVTSEGLTNYRGGAVNIPTSGNTITKYSYVFLSDRLPTDCPSGTTPALYKIKTGKAALYLEFFVDGYPDGTYSTRTGATWTAGS